MKRSSTAANIAPLETEIMRDTMDSMTLNLDTLPDLMTQRNADLRLKVAARCRNYGDKTALATRAGMAPQNLSRWLHGRVEAGPRNLARIERAVASLDYSKR